MLLNYVISLLAIIFAIISYRSKDLNKTSLFQLLSNLFYSLSFMTVFKLSGFVQVSIATVRSLVFYLSTQDGGKNSLSSLIVFEALSMFSLIIFWEGYISLLPFLAVVVFTYGLWQSSKEVFYISATIMSTLLVVYNILICAYVNVILESMLIVTAMKQLITKDTRSVMIRKERYENN